MVTIHPAAARGSRAARKSRALQAGQAAHAARAHRPPRRPGPPQSLKWSCPVPDCRAPQATHLLHRWISSDSCELEWGGACMSAVWPTQPRQPLRTACVHGCVLREMRCRGGQRMRSAACRWHYGELRGAGGTGPLDDSTQTKAMRWGEMHSSN